MQGIKFFSKLIFGLLSVAVLNNSCNPKRIVYKSPPHYDFSKPQVFKLDLKIREISGLAWDNKKDEFLTHNDEKGIVFYLDKESKIIKRDFTFSEKKGDYEDIVMLNEVPYVLRSDGMITKIITDSSGKQYGSEAGKLGLSGTNDFEAMYADVSRKALMVVCKNCDMDEKKTVSVFAFYPDSIGFVEKPVFTIDAAKVAELSPRKTSKLQPSAAAIHPQLKKLFILSSASNQLVITDLDGNVESVYMLAKKLFPQSEGITFKSNGDMYISNEGGVSAKGTIIRFAYIP